MPKTDYSKLSFELHNIESSLRTLIDKIEKIIDTRILESEKRKMKVYTEILDFVKAKHSEVYEQYRTVVEHWTEEGKQ